MPFKRVYMALKKHVKCYIRNRTWYWNLDTSEGISEIYGKLWNVTLEKEGEDQLDLPCKKLHSQTEERNILNTIKQRKTNCIGHILRRNCLLKHVIEGEIEGRIEVTGRWGRRRKQLPDYFKKRTAFWTLEEEAGHIVWRTGFGRGYGPAVR